VATRRPVTRSGQLVKHRHCTTDLVVGVALESRRA
jgi:hypothetical protein